MWVIKLLKFKKKSNGVDFDVNFMDEINIFTDASGTGKTFLFKVLCSYCRDNDMKYAYIDYNMIDTGDEGLILSHCKNKDVIILDNADLYLTPELWNAIRNLNKLIILSKKSTFGLNMKGVHSYTIDYNGSELNTRRLC